LDLLQGGGRSLHVDYANIVLRTLHDLAEVPRSAFGETRHPLSGVALEMELDPLIKKVQRKRLIRGASFRRRNEMIFRILEQETGEQFGSLRRGSGQARRSRVIWRLGLPRGSVRSLLSLGVLLAAAMIVAYLLVDDSGSDLTKVVIGGWIAALGNVIGFYFGVRSAR